MVSAWRNEGATLTCRQGDTSMAQEGDENEASASAAEEGEVTPIKIDGEDSICSVAFVADGAHVVGGGGGPMIRRWGVEDGNEVGTPMNAEIHVGNIAVSRDGKWIVGGMENGQVMVWNGETHERVREFKAHIRAVRPVDVSPDGTTIATGSEDWTVCLWSLSTGQRRLGPLKHYKDVAAIKFSPDGRLFATATYEYNSVRIYTSRKGSLVADFPIQVRWVRNDYLAWHSDSEKLFVSCRNCNIHCLEVSTKTTLSQWTIPGNYNPGCISLASNGTFIAVSDGSSVSFWDITTHDQIGSAVHHSDDIFSMAISAKNDFVVGGGTKITLWKLPDILPPSYFDHVGLFFDQGSDAKNTSLIKNRLVHSDRCARPRTRRIRDVVWMTHSSPFIHGLSIQVCPSVSCCPSSHVRVHQTKKSHISRTPSETSVPNSQSHGAQSNRGIKRSGHWSHRTRRPVGSLSLSRDFTPLMSMVRDHQRKK